MINQVTSVRCRDQALTVSSLGAREEEELVGARRPHRQTASDTNFVRFEFKNAGLCCDVQNFQFFAVAGNDEQVIVEEGDVVGVAFQVLRVNRHRRLQGKTMLKAFFPMTKMRQKMFRIKILHRGRNFGKNFQPQNAKSEVQKQYCIIPRWFGHFSPAPVKTDRAVRVQ